MARTRKQKAKNNVVKQQARSVVNNREESWVPAAAPAPALPAAAASTPTTTTVGLDSLLALLAKQNRSSEPDQRHLITTAAYRGQTEDEHVRLTCSFTVQILTPGWCAVWLLPHSVALIDAHVEGPEGVQASVGAMSSGLGLVAADRGEFEVRLTVLQPYQTARKSGFMMDIPRASRSRLHFTVAGDGDSDVHVDPALCVSRVDSGAVECEIPPTRALSVQWSEAAAVDEAGAAALAEENAPPLSVNCDTVTVLDVGDTVVNVTSTLTFSIRNGSVSVFEVAVPAGVRVYAADGLAIKKWEKGANDVVRVFVEYGLEDRYELRLMAEMDLSGSYNELAAPSFVARGANVERQKGFVCVQARSNVEVSPTNVGNLTLVDVTEVPERLVANPLFVYKFLDPDYDMLLRVRRHKDVDVLIAVVEAAHVLLVHNEEGRTLTKLVAEVRNTQLQFLRIKVPEESEVLSAVVAGLPAKPAEDATGLVMIPLQKSTRGADAQQHSTFTIELVYLSESVPMARHGHRRIGFQLPTVDIPVNKLYVTAYLPEHFRYGQFAGDLREVQYHSGSPPEGGREATREQQVQWGHQQLRVQQQQMSNLASNPIAASKVSRKRNKGTAKANAYCVSDAHAGGFVPVKVDLPQVGSVFRFEQVLVANARLELTVDYRPVDKGYCERRRVDRCVVM